MTTRENETRMYCDHINKLYTLPPLTFPPCTSISYEVFPMYGGSSWQEAKICTCQFVPISNFTSTLDDQNSLAGPEAGKYLVSNYSVAEADVLLGPYTYDVNLYAPNKSVFHPSTTWAASNIAHYEVQMYQVVNELLDLTTPICTINPWRADVNAPFKYANHLYEHNNCQLTQMTHSEDDGGCGGERVFVISTKAIAVGEEIGVSYGNDKGVAAFLEKEINFKLHHRQTTIIEKGPSPTGYITYGEFLSCTPVPAGKMVLDFQKCSFKFGKPVQKVKMSFKKETVKPKKRLVKLKVPEEELFMNKPETQDLFPELYSF